MAEDERYLHAGTFLQRLFFPPYFAEGCAEKELWQPCVESE